MNMKSKIDLYAKIRYEYRRGVGTIRGPKRDRAVRTSHVHSVIVVSNTTPHIGQDDGPVLRAPGALKFCGWYTT